ncbi:hypothetical protein FRB94_002516 [Tulasnella sp. JGI-2019a]|nr:hypothetical protein FRB93_010164 [Tulasnella sp. JGI-2019a]KAG9013442.1 hypothetical protein FRB94_002516 [Tulasnella sp. JGI-2019a]
MAQPATAVQDGRLTVAIAGGTGNIGTHVVKAFLNPSIHLNTFPRVLVLTRNSNSHAAKELEKLGAELVQTDGLLEAEALRSKSVDVLVSCLGQNVAIEEKGALYKAAIDGGVKVYFPTEYGIDHRIDEAKHKVWDDKKKHSRAAREASGENIKIIQLYNGHFMEDAIGPWYALDTKNRHYTSIGPSTSKFTLTSKDDVGASIVRLALLAVGDPNSVPNEVRISGDAKSYQELASIMGSESDEKIDITEQNVDEYKASLGPLGADPAPVIRVIIGSGLMDYTKENNNELVNPGELVWKWKKVEQYAKEVKGKPWCD